VRAVDLELTSEELDSLSGAEELAA